MYENTNLFFFKLQPLSGATDCTVDLILLNLLDITKMQTFNISLIVSDKAGLAATQDINAEVLDVNIAPTVTTFNFRD